MTLKKFPSLRALRILIFLIKYITVCLYGLAEMISNDITLWGCYVLDMKHVMSYIMKKQSIGSLCVGFFYLFNFLPYNRSPEK